MQGKDTTKSTFNQFFQSVLRFKKYLKTLEVDKYVKKFTAFKFILLMSFAQLNQLKSLRDISRNLNSEQLSQSIDLSSISPSQISRKQRDKLMEAVQALFRKLSFQAGLKQGFARVQQKIGRLYLIDSTVISMCLARYRWAKFRKTKGGIKMHTRINLCEGNALPDTVEFTAAKKADRTQMDKMVVKEKDAFNVFDRAYVDYRKFDYYCANHIRFASRLKGNALVKTLEELPTNPDSNITGDRKVILGKEGFNQMHHPLRIIETKDSKDQTIIIVTNDFSLSAEEIGDIYRYRWQIELFFKWIKQHLHVKHFYGTGEQAVVLQLFIALITYCLLLLLKQEVGYQGSLLDVKRCLNASLYEPFSSFVRKLYRSNKYSATGRRRKNDPENIYQITVRQVNSGETGHLDDLTYDPVIL